MIDVNYFLYMAESDGLDKIVTTKQARINAAIKDLINYAKKGYNINTLQEDILAKHNLKLTDLSVSDINYIKRKVEKAFK